MYNITTTNNPEPHNLPRRSILFALRPRQARSVSTWSRACADILSPALLVGLLLLGLGLAVVAKHKPTFVATSTIYVSPTPIKTLVDDRELERPYDSYVQETVHDIDRYDVIAEAIHRLPPGVWAVPGEPERTAVLRLQQSLGVQRVAQTYQVAISVEGARPEHLADIVNTITAVYLEKAKSEEFYGRDDRLASLKEEQGRIQAQTDALLKEQDQINKTLGVASVISKSSSVIDQQNAKVQSDLIAAHGVRIQAEAQLNALSAGDASAPNSAMNTAADELIATDPALSALKSNLSVKRAQLLDQLAGLTPNHPLRRQTEDQLAQIEKELTDMQARKRKEGRRPPATEISNPVEPGADGRIPTQQRSAEGHPPGYRYCAQDSARGGN